MRRMERSLCTESSARIVGGASGEGVMSEPVRANYLGA